MPAFDHVEKADKPMTKIIKRFRYYCYACTNAALYAPEPYQFGYIVCRHCGKVLDGTNYAEENWLPMSDQEIQEVNIL